MDTKIMTALTLAFAKIIKSTKPDWTDDQIYDEAADLAHRHLADPDVKAALAGI